MKRCHGLLMIMLMFSCVNLFASAAQGADSELDKLEKKLKLTNELLKKKLNPQERASFEFNGDLPTTDEFVNKIKQPIKDYDNLLKKTDDLRAKLSKKAGGVLPDDKSRLDEVERQVGKVIGGKERFQPGAKWTGSMQINGNATVVDLEITNAANSAFSGQLAETTQGGRPARMEMGGEVNCVELNLATGKMLLGPPRSRTLSGTVFRDRFVGVVVAVENGKKGPITTNGAVELKLKPAKR